MKRVKAIVSYDGTDFAGYQITTGYANGPIGNR